MNLPFISIAIATYNGSKYLSKQLDSVLQQTYTNLEIIIVDDYSTDDTVKILENYQDSRIKLYQNSQNLGLLKTFSRAIELSHGEYVALCDQDDIWLPHKIETIINHIGDNLLIHSDAKLIDKEDHVIGNSHFAYAKRKDKNTFIDYLISNNVTGCTCLFSKKLKELALPFPEYFYSHDHYLGLVASFYGKIKLLDEPLILYRQHGANAIGAKRPSFEQFFIECKKKADSYDSMLKLPQFQNNPDIILFRDYRKALAEKESLTWRQIKALLKIKSGYKLFGYYYIMRYIPRVIAEVFYAFKVSVI